MAFPSFCHMRDAPSHVEAIASEHAAYWKRLGLRGFRGGPFADRSGGLITFEALSDDEAERLVAGDPFVKPGSSRAPLREGVAHRVTCRTKRHGRGGPSRTTRVAPTRREQ